MNLGANVRERPRSRQGAFHGHPSDGIAEIGYGIEERSRGQGLAKPIEAASAESAEANSP